MIVKCLSKPSLISRSPKHHVALPERGFVTYTCGIICSLPVFSHKSINSTNKGRLLGMLARVPEIPQGVPDT